MKYQSLKFTLEKRMKYPIDLTTKADVTAYFDESTNTITYLVKDPSSNHCAIIDSVMDMDYAAGRITYESADKIINEIQNRELILDWIIETHVHADHLSAAPYIQLQLGGKIGVGEKIMLIQETFGKIFNEGTEFQRDGSQFDALFKDGDTYMIGNMQAITMFTPGHTPACMVHIIGDSAFAGELYDSIQKVLTLPDETRLFMCHDYGPNGRSIQWETTVLEQKNNNIHVGKDKTRDDFIKFRTERDAQLAMPKLIIPALQVNMRAGEVPTDNNGNKVLKVPVNGLE